VTDTTPEEKGSHNDLPAGGSDPGQGQSPLPAEPLVTGEEDEAVQEESEVELLQKELALLETQLQSMRDRYIRAVADLDNARKRARRAISDARVEGAASVLTDLLVLMDNFERALDTSRPAARDSAKMRALYEGIELIYRQLAQLLDRHGVEPIEALAAPFDPGRHEAVTQVPAGEGRKEGTVALETQKGYMMGKQVLRPSKVGVVVPQEEPQAPEGEQ
jgi:molecular chaperone GrpE